MNRGGRPPVGDAVKVKLPPDLLASIDTAADIAGISRSEWIRRACSTELRFGMKWSLKAGLQVGASSRD